MFARNQPLSILLTAALLLLVGACSKGPTGGAGAPSGGASPSSEAGVVAVVDGEPITTIEVERLLDQLVADQSHSPANATASPDLLRAGLRHKALSDLIDRKVQVMEARKRNLPVSNADINQLYAECEKKYASPEEFKQVVAALKYTPDEFRKGLADDVRVTKLADQWKQAHPVEVTDQEVEELYRQRKQMGQMMGPDGKEIPLDQIKDKLRGWMTSFKLQKDYEKWVSELRSSAQVVETAP